MSEFGTSEEAAAFRVPAQDRETTGDPSVELDKRLKQEVNRVWRSERELKEFLARPLTDLHEALRRGERHPRWENRVAMENMQLLQLKRDRVDEEDEEISADELRPRTVEDWMVEHVLRPDEVSAYLTLRRSPDPRLQRAGLQMENGFYTEAAEAIRDVLSAHPDQEIAAIESLLRERDIQREMVAKTEQFSQTVYDRLIQEEPERKAEIARRREVEFQLRHGQIVSWTPIKAIEHGLHEQPQTFTSEASLTGDMKAFLVEIQKVDAQGNLVPGTVKAIVKSSHSDFPRRDYTEPIAMDANEWQAGIEATVLGSDVVPPTVLRETSFGRVSVQEYVEFVDSEGNLRGGIQSEPMSLMVAGLPTDFEAILTREDVEDVAMLHRFGNESDGSAQNLLLYYDASENRWRGRAIDNANRNGVKKDLFVSAACVERGGQVISDRGRKKLERYARRRDLIDASLDLTQRGDTAFMKQNRTDVAKQLLATGSFPRYDGSVEHLLDRIGVPKRREDGSIIVDAFGRAVVPGGLEFSRLRKAYPERIQASV